MSNYMNYFPVDFGPFDSPAPVDNTRVDVQTKLDDLALKKPEPKPKQRRRSKPVVQTQEPVQAPEEPTYRYVDMGNPGHFDGPGLNVTDKVDVPKFVRGMRNKPIETERSPMEFPPLEYPETQEPRRRSTWLSRVLSPDDNELIAADNGMRWHWYMENRPMWSGYDRDNSIVWDGVDRENQYIAQLLKAQKASQMSPLAEARRMGQYQNMYKQWEKMVADGKFDDGNGGLSQEGVDAYNRIRDAFLQEFPDKNPDTVMLPMHNQIAARKNIMTGNLMKQWSAINQMDSTYNQLRQLDQAGQLYTKDGLIDPQYAPVLDLFMTRVAAILTGSTGALADAEKIRLQYEFATEEVKGILDKNIKEYFTSLSEIASAAMTGNATLAANEDLRTVAAGGKDASSLSRIATAIERLVGNEDNRLHAIGVALDANSEAFEQSIQRFMLQGYVDITKLLGSASIARTNLANDWNASAALARRDERIAPATYDYQFKPPGDPHFPMPTYTKYVPPDIKPDATNQRIAKRYNSKTANTLNDATGYGPGISGWK